MPKLYISFWLNIGLFLWFWYFFYIKGLSLVLLGYALVHILIFSCYLLGRKSLSIKIPLALQLNSVFEGLIERTIKIVVIYLIRLWGKLVCPQLNGYLSTGFSLGKIIITLIFISLTFLYIYIIPVAVINIALNTPLNEPNYTNFFFKKFDGLFFTEAGFSDTLKVVIKNYKVITYYKCP